MKKALITLLAASTCAFGAELVAEWDGFSSLSSTVGGKTYTLAMNNTYSSVTDGVLSVSNDASETKTQATATIDLSAANLTMDSGLTVSFTLSNLDVLGGNSRNPAGMLGLATSNDFAFLASYFMDKNQYGVAYNGSSTKVTSELTVPRDEDNNIIKPSGNTPITITLTIKDSAVGYYVNGDSIGTATLDTTDGDLTSEEITSLSLGSWVGSTNNSRSTAKFYDLAVYNGAMTATEVKALIIPEPTTATLSLLALAGLAARRRRK